MEPEQASDGARPTAEADRLQPPADGRPTETWGPGQQPPAVAAPIAEGAVVRLGESWELTVLRELGRGGMGTVYLVRDRRLGREAALKVVRDPTPDRVERFRREAEITARLSHPAIPPVYDAAQTRAGLDYMLMRYVSGRSLGERFERYHERRQRRARSGRVMPLPRDLLEVLVKVSDALAYAHSKGVVHRDLKPQNVLLGPFGETVLLDWGLAIDLEHPGQSAREVVGTVGYMAPEQARGEAVDARSDVFGLGVLLTEALTARLPVEGEEAAEVLERLRAGTVRTPAQILPGVAPELDAIAAKALSPDPSARYSDAGAFAEDLRAFLAGEPVSVYRESSLRRARRWLAQHPTFVVALVLGLIGAALIVQARSWERDALVREAQREVGRLRQRGQLEAGDALGQAWALLSAATRWHTLAPEDPDAGRARHNSALMLGDLALEGGQWTLARRAYGEAMGLGIDDALVHSKLEQVAASQTAEEEYRSERIRFALEQIDAYPEPPRAALDELVFHGAAPSGKRQLIRALEVAAQDLAWSEVRLLVGEVSLDPRWQRSLVSLNDALIELRERQANEPLLARHREVLIRARSQALQAARKRGVDVADYWELLARQQREVCSDSLRRGAALVAVFRRLVRLEAARGALFNYGTFVADPRLARPVAELLVDLGAGRSALGPVQKYGETSEVFREILARLESRLR